MMKTPDPKTLYLKDYQVPDYLIQQVELSFILDSINTQVISRLTIQRNPVSINSQADLELAGENLELLKISLNGTVLSPECYSQTEQSLTIYPIPVTGVFTLEIQNNINPSANTALEGLYASNEMLCTQCEAQGFRKITYYLDRPDVMAKFTTILIADKSKYPVLLSNGNKVSSGDLTNNRHWVRWEDPFAKPCYLFALVAGQLAVVEDEFTTMSGREIALQIFVDQQDQDKCAHAMQSLKNAMTWDEQVYGREYDLDLYMIVAVNHFNMGAMENKGLNIFNTKFVLARPDTATDSDYEQIEGVIGHEYFHNWSGNRITCRDWFQLSLKEGFTVFRDQSFTADQTSQGVKRIEDVNLLRTRQFAEDSSPLSHPIRPESYIEINNFYTLTIYEKGAEVVRMLHTLLGAEWFRKGCDLYFAEHDGQAVTCDDFVQALATATETDLTQFKRWYSQSGTPVLSVEQHYNPTTKSLILDISQISNSPEPLHIPITLGLFNPDGTSASIDYAQQQSLELVLELTANKQRFEFKNLPQEPIVSLLRGFSAPVKLNMSQSFDDLIFLLNYETDPFNRWEAGQKLTTKIIFDVCLDVQQGKTLHLEPMLYQAFNKLLTQDWTDLSYFSLLITLPTENYLAEQMAIVDVEVIHTAREFVKLQLAQQLQVPLTQLYITHHKNDCTQADAQAIGRRRIKNQCLDYLNCLETSASYQRAATQFKTAQNMTDQIGALEAIVNSNHPEKARFLEQFYQQWHAESLVIDKWFTLQASSYMPNTFEQVVKLMSHPAFDLHTPNRVRALIGAFCQNNPLHFHAKNGTGYKFLADQVLALNIINPQVASRMVSALTRWQRYDDSRQEKIKQQLERIITAENISKDVYELVSKSLR